MSDLDFGQVFETATGFKPFGYQCRLACGKDADADDRNSLRSGSECESKLINVPTGLGKTAAVVMAWAWNRVINKDSDWPRRLVYCLPMRTLVEQTRDETERWLGALRDKFAVKDNPDQDDLHRLAANPPVVLMGGEEATDWDLHPERPAILIGTQDMLLSRALNRGYGMGRNRWPMHFGLLNNDCLWVMDETQLMGPGLWTSAQLDWMRQDRFPVLRPCVTWWMSATISPDFLDTIDRRNSSVAAPEGVTVQDEPRATSLLKAQRPCRFWKQAAVPRSAVIGRRRAGQEEGLEELFAADLAKAVVQEHASGTLSLVVCNTVRFAQILFESVMQKRDDVILLTSRFRPNDRKESSDTLIAFERKRKTRQSHPGLICISTQVVEAGIDVSARRLWSEIAPWPSTLQRLGRLNRDGRINDEALAFFFELPQAGKTPGRGPSPYEPNDLADGKKLLKRLLEVSAENPRASFHNLHAQLASETEFASLSNTALQPKPEPFPRAIDVHGLFTNEPDAFGGFTDVSRFVRGEDRSADATVFWRNWKAETDYVTDVDGPAFYRDEGCPVAIHRVREFLGEKGRGWSWNANTERWESARGDELVPGMLIMLPASGGGYDRRLGWTGRKTDTFGLKDAPPPGPPEERTVDDQAIGCWVDLETHLADAEKAAESIVEVFPPESPFRNAILQSARYHDIGKSISQWQQALPQPRPQSADFWAKAPFLLRIEAEHRKTPSTEAIEEVLRKDQIPFRRVTAQQPGRRSDLRPGELHFHLGRKPSIATAEALCAVAGVSKAVIARFRPGLRHEAASALALWRRFYYDNHVDFPALTLYGVAAHHGVVRTSLSSRDREEPNICGIPLSVSQIPWGGGMPLDFDCAQEGASGDFSEDGKTFILRAPGWSGLVTDLLGGWEKAVAGTESIAVPKGEPSRLGPFGLAYFEALIRAADGRASKSPSRFVTADGKSS